MIFLAADDNKISCLSSKPNNILRLMIILAAASISQSEIDKHLVMDFLFFKSLLFWMKTDNRFSAELIISAEKKHIRQWRKQCKCEINKYYEKMGKI